MIPNDANPNFNNWFDSYLAYKNKKKKEVELPKKQEGEEICDWCGLYEDCDSKRHNKDHLRNLLVDAGVIEDTNKAFQIWWTTQHHKEDKEKVMMGYDPHTVYGVYPKKVAKFVRSIL